MALKRTLVPFYGAANSRLEHAARRAIMAGDVEQSRELFSESRKRYDSRRKKHAEERRV